MNVSRFRYMSPRLARLVLLAAAALVMYGIVITRPTNTNEPGPGEGDMQLYQSIISRVQAGENYYQAAGDELRSRGYATRPSFNWRLPTLALLIGRILNMQLALVVIGLLGLLTVVLWLPALLREGGPVAAGLGGLLLCGALVLGLNESAVVFHELWAGVLIAISLGAHARERWLLSIAGGLAALLVRELALPFALLMAWLAWREQRYRDLGLWLLGLLIFGVYMAWHTSTVLGLLSDADRSNSWVALGGWRFVVATAQWNLLLLLAPAWAPAVALPLALLGLAGWRGRAGRSMLLTAGVYVAAFMVVGRPDNVYWGLMYAPLLALGLAMAAPALRDLAHASLGRAPDAIGEARTG